MQSNEFGVKHLLELHHLVAVRELVLLLPPADPLRIGQLLRQDLDVVVGAVRVGRVRVPVLEDGVLPQTDLQLPQEDSDHPLVFDGLRRIHVMGKQGIATENYVRRNEMIKSKFIANIQIRACLTYSPKHNLKL